MTFSPSRRPRAPWSGNAALSETASEALAPAFRVALAVLLSLALVSCAKRPALKPPEQAVAPYEGPVTIEALKNSSVFRKIKALKSEVRVRVYRDGRKVGSFRGVLLYEQPSSVRMRLFNAFGSTAVDLLHSDGLLQLYMPGKRHLYEGRTPLPKKLSHTLGDDGKSYVLFAHSPDGGGPGPVATYTYDRRTLLNTGIRVYRDGESFLDIRFDNFSGTIPYTATMSLLNGYSMRMELKRPSLDPVVSSEFFEPFGHEGKKVFPLRLILREREGR